jgi:hypothetical protein
MFRNLAIWIVPLGMYEGVLTGLDASLNIRSLTIGVADTCQPQTDRRPAASSERVAPPTESLMMMRGAIWPSKTRHGT